MAKCYAIGWNNPGFLGNEVYYYRDPENAIEAYRGLVGELGLGVPPSDEVRRGLDANEGLAVAGYSPEVFAEVEVWISEVNEPAACEDYPGFVG